ncbi:MAG: S41 family peptidase [Thermoleophilia bacterium]|nr:S41 family peptidase [Thermoleophilia bacterium]
MLAVFVAGVVVGGHPEATGINRLPDPVRGTILGDSGRALPDQVLDVIEDGYYTEVDRAKLERASVEGILEALGDPYTRYLSPEDLARAREQADGAYSGIGIRIARVDDGVVVAGIFPGGPAAKAGVKAGDRVVSVDGRAVRSGDIDAVVEGIKGPTGTDVKVGFARRGRDKPLELTLTRARIELPVVSSRMIGPPGRRIAYVRLDQFTRGSARAVRQAAERLIEQGAKGVVLDLRGDPGGLVDEAVGVASVFLRKGQDVVTTEGRNEPRRTLRARGGAIDPKVPVVVLVDRDTASSSEIVAGALRDQDRATVIGTRTFGKALVQVTRLLPEGGAVRVTSARYLTPDGVDIAKRGVTPDVVARDDPATPRRDEALDRALAELGAR